MWGQSLRRPFSSKVKIIWLHSPPEILLLNLVSTDVLEPHVLVVLDLSDHVRNANAACRMKQNHHQKKSSKSIIEGRQIPLVFHIFIKQVLISVTWPVWGTEMRCNFTKRDCADKDCESQDEDDERCPPHYDDQLPHHMLPNKCGNSSNSNKV